MTSPQFRPVSVGSPDYEQTLMLRERVLLAPFQIDLARAKADDGAAHHFGLFDPAGTCLACLLLVPRSFGEAQMRQVAVASELQRQGLGRLLLVESEREAERLGFREIFAHARETALPFYRALGYREEGEPFMQVGLPHRTVRKALAHGPEDRP